MKVIERILTTAKEKNIKQADIAAVVQKDKGTITNWKKYNTNPPIELIEPIAELLGVSIQWLITGKEVTEHTAEETELLKEYSQLSAEDREEVRAIIRMKLDRAKPQGKVLTSESA